MSFTEIDFESEIKKLNPVTWIYNNDPKKEINIGYIAEDLDKVDALKFLVEKDLNGNIMGIKYEIISVYLVEAIKVAYQKIDKLENEIKQLKSCNS